MKPTRVGHTLMPGWSHPDFTAYSACSQSAALLVLRADWCGECEGNALRAGIAERVVRRDDDHGRQPLELAQQLGTRGGEVKRQSLALSAARAEGGLAQDDTLAL